MATARENRRYDQGRRSVRRLKQYLAWRIAARHDSARRQGAELYPDTFEFEGNRAIVLRETTELPVAPLKHCISLALTYHRRKKLPLLGA